MNGTDEEEIGAINELIMMGKTITFRRVGDQVGVFINDDKKARLTSPNLSNLLGYRWFRNEAYTEVKGLPDVF